MQRSGGQLLRSSAVLGSCTRIHQHAAAEPLFVASCDAAACSLIRQAAGDSEAGQVLTACTYCFST